jgi:imidazole glycerol-phosphate synthase subunit HisF
MLRPRVIPCLLLRDGGLVKTVRFGNAKYVGDPINAVRIFNEKEADELIVLDIDATAQGRAPDYKLIALLAAECRMPMCYGGGVRTLDQAKRIIGLGVEKVSLGAAALSDPGLVTAIARAAGTQSTVVVLDVRLGRDLARNEYELCSQNAFRVHAVAPLDFAQQMQAAGAGEIVVNSVDRDGEMKGYDLNLARQMREAVSIPLTILGGAGTRQDIEALFRTCGVVGAAAGAFFVFKGKYRAVLISYPGAAERDEMASLAFAASTQAIGKSPLEHV